GEAGARAAGPPDEQLALFEALLRLQELVAFLLVRDVQTMGADIAGFVANRDKETVTVERRDRQYPPFLAGEPSVGRRRNACRLLKRDEETRDHDRAQGDAGARPGQDEGDRNERDRGGYEGVEEAHEVAPRRSLMKSSSMRSVLLTFPLSSMVKRKAVCSSCFSVSVSWRVIT